MTWGSDFTSSKAWALVRGDAYWNGDVAGVVNGDARSLMVAFNAEASRHTISF